MMRTNFLSRIKKVCSPTIVPRILRGDLSAKSEILSCAAVRTAAKSTKTTDDGPSDQKDTDEKSFVRVLKEPSLDKNTQVLNTSDGGIPETQYERCQKIIQQTFGTDEPEEPDITEQYCSRGVDIAQTRQELKKSERLKFAKDLLTDDRTQCAVLKTAPDLKEAQTHIPINPQPKPADTDPNEDVILMKPALNVHLMSTRAPDDLIIKDAENSKEQTNDNLPLEESIAKEEVSKYVHSREKIDKTMYETHDDPKQSTVKTIDTSKIGKEQNAPRIIIPNVERNANDPILKKSHLPNSEHMGSVLKNDKKFYEIFDNYLHPQIRHNAFVNTTTAKEEQDQLTQKLEHIEETPLVEAQRQPIEGFNITPRVLGDLETAYSWLSSKHAGNLSADHRKNVDLKLDEAAKRTLENPDGRIDETLLHELENLGIPLTCKDDQTRSQAIDDNRVQMNILRSYTKLDTLEEDDTIPIFTDKMYPIQPKVSEKLLRVLGDTENAIRWVTSKQSSGISGLGSKSGDSKLNEEAKSALENPIGLIDQTLHDELENLGISITGQEDQTQPDDSRVQMNILRSCNKLDHFGHDDPVAIYDKMYPLQPKVTEILLPDKEAEAQELALKLAEEEEEDSATMYPIYDRSTFIIPPEVKPQEVKEKAQTVQVNPAEIPSIIEEMSSRVSRRKRASLRKRASSQSAAVNTKENINEPNEKVEAQQFYARLNTEAEQVFKVTENWNPLARRGYRYVVPFDMTAFDKQNLRKSCAKGMEKPTYYQSVNVANIWKTQKQLAEKYTRRINPKPTEKGHTYLSMNLTTKWDHDSSRKCRHNANIPNTADIKEKEQAKLFTPAEARERSYVPKPKPNYMTAPPLRQPNNINANVSDGIWDESVDALISKDKTSLQEEFMKQQLDPYYVLTCNETCPIAPKPATSRLKESTEAIYDTQNANQKDQNEFMNVRTPGHASAETVRISNAKQATSPDALKDLPELTDDISLSELLRRVRERNRILQSRNVMKCQGVKVDPVQAQVGKCPRKAPQCLPTAPRPPRNPLPPPGFGLPQLKPRPPSCKPRKGTRTRKCSSCHLDLSSGLHLGPELNVRVAEVRPEMVCEMKDIRTDVCGSRLRADLTDEVVERLQTLGQFLTRLLDHGKTYLIEAGHAVCKNRPGLRTMLARDYAPWTPIPSWPTPKQPTKRKPPCEPGCPFPPPLTKMNPEPPCNLKPCKGFPKKSFSLVDCFAVTVGENKVVYEIGKF